MEEMIIKGGSRLKGTVKAEGAKNAVLPVMAASLLASEGTSTLYDVPALDDVFTIQEVLQSLNAEITYNHRTVTVNAEASLSVTAPSDYVQKMRASFVVLGPLLARKGHARMALPGGCSIGTRPVDQHLKGFEAMGAEVHIGNGFIEAKVQERLKGANIYLDFPSVGATENIMMAAVLAEGTTTIENVAEEPEIVCLANYLNAMGAKVRGAGTGAIRIEGVNKLYGAQQTIIPDRIEAGTFMTAAAMTGGDVLVEDAVPEHMMPLISKLREMGVDVTEEDEGIRVISERPLHSVDIKTMPHPGFPTDLQPQMMALLMTADGTGIVTETVFENRFMHAEEFGRMNADITIEGRTAIVQGVASLQGARVEATDLRAGAALVLAGLYAEGETIVTELHHIDRGYVQFADKLRSLGADISRTDDVKAAMPNKIAESKSASIKSL